MLKRILRETSLSIKRNPVKIILLSLVLLISSNLVFGALGIFKAVNEKMYEVKDFTKRHVQMEYIDLDLVDESSLNIHNTLPVFIYDYLPDNLKGIANYQASGVEIFSTLTEGDHEYNVEKYLGPLEELGLFPNAMHIEIETEYGIKYLTEPFININNSNFTTYDHIELIEGTYPPTENNKTDLVISENLSKEGNYQVGDDFKIIYGRTPMIFKVGGIYKPISDEVSDYIILGGMQGFHEKYNNNFGSKYNLWSNFSATFDSPEEAESSVEVINQILQENDRTQNLQLVNREVQYESFIAGLNQYKTISVAVILIVIITAVILIAFVVNRDIKHTEDDLFSTMFEDDKQIKRRSNLFIILIISIFSLSVSYFTAPALNNTFTTSLVLDKMTYGEEEFPNPFENKEDFIEFYKMTAESSSDPVYTYSYNFDNYVIVNLDYSPTVYTTLIYVIIISGISLLGVKIGNRRFN